MLYFHVINSIGPTFIKLTFQFLHGYYISKVAYTEFFYFVISFSKEQRPILYSEMAYWSMVSGQLNFLRMLCTGWNSRIINKSNSQVHDVEKACEEWRC